MVTGKLEVNNDLSMKNSIKIILTIICIVTFSCDLDKDLDNPNEVGISAADPTLLLNGVQVDFASFYSKVDGADNIDTNGLDQLVRYRAFSSGFTFEEGYLAEDVDDIWEDSYKKTLVNIETLIPLAEEGNFTTHVAVAKILKAYTYVTLVDIFGDVPASQALKQLSPEDDPGSDIYDMAFVLLDEARTELAKTGTEVGPALERDIFYNGNRAKWTKFANSLEFKMWMNISMISSRQSEAIAELTALSAPGLLIETDADEFTYKYGTSPVPSSSRHPLYTDTYRPVEGDAGGWIANHFMKQMFNGSGVQDPRWRYYFYRQVGSLFRALQVDPQSIDCVNSTATSFTNKPIHYEAAGFIYCAFDPGFYGRDFGNAESSNPDGSIMTVPGVYPVGGRVDLNPTGDAGDPSYHGPTIVGQGGNGGGILPIYMSWFTDFMKAEAVLRLGMPGDAKELMLSGVNKSINRVRSFGASKGQTVPASIEPSQVAYTANLGALYDNSSDQVDVVINEYYKSLYGNAIEMYNAYRRTGSPKNFQTLRDDASGGNFWRTLPYPARYVNLNANASPKSGPDAKTFWDTNPVKIK